MPRDGSGVYHLPSGNPVVTNTLISSVWANTTLSDIAAALTGSLPRDGTAGMTGNLDFGNHNGINLLDPVNAQDAATKHYVDPISNNLNTASAYLTEVRGLTGASASATSVAFYFNRIKMVPFSGNNPILGPALNFYGMGGGNFVANVDFTLAGPVAGGRDQAAAFNSQWVYIYAIWGASAGNIYGIATANPNGPALPAGYTHAAFLCPVRISSTNNNPVGFLCRNNHVFYSPRMNNVIYSTGIAVGSIVQFVNYGAFVPPSPCGKWYDMGLYFNGVTTTQGYIGGTFSYYDQQGGTELDRTGYFQALQASTSWSATFPMFKVPITNSSPVIVVSGDSTWAQNAITIYAKGFEFENGSG